MMDPAIVRSVLTYALEHGAEFAELFVEDKEELSQATCWPTDRL